MIVLFLIMLWYMTCGILLSNITLRNVADWRPPRRTIDNMDMFVCVVFFGLLWPLGVAVMLFAKRRFNRGTK